ncbi:MAG TPA: AarF/ABC1/UbiB kinase family protein [Candidatus Saccharibacteria bacterium]|jgi:hypothetical protein|nr:AarF/ABC1/UbiB kinase family protein [Candidatus Saccharibacteria bacterium]
MKEQSRKDYQQLIKSIKKNRRNKIVKIIAKAIYLNRIGKKEDLYTYVCDEFTLMGGVYVKFLQGVLLRSEVMRNWQNPDKLKIFENLDLEDIDLKSVLEKELGDKLNNFEVINPESFAAGSFGQVYYAKLKGGKPVVIKVLRPMIKETLKYDLRLIKFFTRQFTALLASNMDLSLKDALKDFSLATTRETDYIGEANFAAEMWENYKSHPKLVIPETYLELCTEQIITQEYIDGLSVAHLVNLQNQGYDLEQYVKLKLNSDLTSQLTTLGVAYLADAFRIPRLQGDPHPGNIRLMTDDRIALIDFGIWARTPKNKAAFFGVLKEYEKMFSGGMNIKDLFGAFMRFFVNDLYRALNKINSSLPPKEQKDDINNQLGNMVSKTFDTETGGNFQLDDFMENGNLLVLVNQIVNKGNKFGFVLKVEDTDMVRAAQTYLTLVESLGMRSKVIPVTLTQVVSVVRSQFPELEHAGDRPMTLSQAMETVSNWLERIADRDPVLFSALLEKFNRARKEQKNHIEESAPGVIEPSEQIVETNKDS